MRNFTFVSGCLSLLAFCSANASSQVNSTSVMTATGMSPDGNYIVGSRSLTDNEGLFTSALWNADEANSQPVFLTGYNPSDPYAGGAFTCVNNLGTIGGFYLSQQSYSQENSEETNAIQLYAAAIWKDGKMYDCGFGDYQPDAFKMNGDGARIVAISDDGNTALGTISIESRAVESGIWQYDASTDKYSYSPLATIDGGCPVAYDMSGDASVIAGYIRDKEQSVMRKAYLWTLHDGKHTPQQVMLNSSYQVSANNAMVSDNGKYVVIISYPTSYYLIEVETEAISEFEYPECFDVWKIGGLDNNGNYLTIVVSYFSGDYCSDYHNNINETSPFIPDIFNKIPDLPMSDQQIAELEAITISADGQTWLANGKSESFRMKVNTSLITGVDCIKSDNKPDVVINGHILTVSDKGVKTISLYTLDGRLISQNSGNELNIQNASKGIYIVKTVNKDNSSFSFKTTVAN